LDRAEGHPAGPRLILAIGDTSEEAVAGHAADLAKGVLAGWINTAAV
jgi:hypothetical protein